jgi:hypothetical protein
MRDINQKASDTDKQIAIAHSAPSKALALRRSVRLSYLLSLRVLSTGGLSIFAIAALLGMKPAQANTTEPSASPPNPIAGEEQASSTSSQSSELNASGEFNQALVKDAPNETAKENVHGSTFQSSSQATSSSANLNATNTEVALTSSTDAPDDATVEESALKNNVSRSALTLEDSLMLRKRSSASRSQPQALPTPTEYNPAPSAIEKGNFSSLPSQPSTGENASYATESRESIVVPTANSLSFAKDRITTPNPDSQVPETQSLKPATVGPAFVPPPSSQAATPNPAEPQIPQMPSTEGTQPTTILPGFSPGATAFAPTQDGVEYKVLKSSAEGKQSTTILPSFSLNANTSALTPNPVEPRIPQPVAQETQPTTILPSSALRDASAPIEKPTQPSPPQPVAKGTQPTLIAQTGAPNTNTGVLSSTPTSEAYKGPGAAALLQGGIIQAQSSVDAAQEAQSQNALRTNNPLAPSLTFQGGLITQGETGARARVTGLYPVSPNLLFGGTVDLTTGKGFSDTGGTGLDLNELYVTASLPSYPNLRLTAGLVDLTSYFDRNSFAKDSLTHFFNPVFQTNPALARAGIASRPAVLLNWDITDNLQARVAGFSSSRSLGDIAPDGFAGELAFRAGNGIIRGTYVTDRDVQKNGFNEIYGISRSNGEFGPRSSDRESAYGVNAEYYLPEIKMGLFGRYGHYENTSIGKGGDTYSAGLNFLDLFMKDDRLGFGYGRDLSNDSLRRASRNKVPDVWEVFYDFRLTSYLRAGVTLQARDEFSDIVAGFRVKTEFDLLNLGRAFR